MTSPTISTEKKHGRIILIVDTDLGFVFWLGQALDHNGYQALPARSVEDACSLLEQLKLQIDVLLVNPSLQGTASLIDSLRCKQGHLKVIALTSSPEEPVPTGFDTSKSKPLQIDKEAKGEWLELIQSVLSVATPLPVAEDSAHGPPNICFAFSA